MEDAAGRRVAGAGILDLTTSPGRRRAVGEVVSVCELPGVGMLTGFENHRGVTTLGPRDVARWPGGAGCRATARGTGATACCAGTVIGTYLHGPVLARNPALADHVLRGVVGGDLAPLELPDQDLVRRLRLAGHRLRGRPFSSGAA